MNTNAIPTRTRLHGPRWALGSAVAVAALTLMSVPAQAEPAAAPTPAATSSTSPQPARSCPALAVIGIQSGQEGAASGVDTGDTGLLGQAFGRIGTAAGDLVQRSYIVYGAETSSESTGYVAAVAAAADEIEQTVTEVIGRCPSAQVAVAGYAQGAAAAGSFAEKVGAGQSSVPADKIAAIALVANPARRAAATVLPGTDSSTPTPASGTDGTNTRAISLSNVGLSGAGIAAAANPVSYGSLTGRVADLCVAGDATCDVRSGSPLLTAVANISGQAEGRDPVTAIGVVAEALASTAFTTAVGVVSEDISGSSLDQLSYDPSKTLGQRIAEASSPTAATATGSDALEALFKIGSIGLNSVIAVAEKVLTVSTITELATVGLADPTAAFATLAAKVAEAVVDLVPPQTISTWVTSAFEAITSTITDTSDLYTTSATAQYSDATGRRASYTSVPATSSGDSPLTVVADWFIALSRDLAPTTDTVAPATSPPASTTNPSESTTPVTSTPSPTHAATTTPRP